MIGARFQAPSWGSRERGRAILGKEGTVEKALLKHCPTVGEDEKGKGWGGSIFEVCRAVRRNGRPSFGVTRRSVCRRVSRDRAGCVAGDG